MLGLLWTAEVVLSSDAVLAETTDVVVTSGSVVLDRAGSWLNLAALALTLAPPYWLFDLEAPC